VFIVGSATGKDGIHGAAIRQQGHHRSTSMDDLPAVQVGDPFMEKLLLGSLARIDRHRRHHRHAGHGRGGHHLQHQRDERQGRKRHGRPIGQSAHCAKQGMQPWEILLSESQERMLVVVKKGREQEVQAIFDKWDLNCVEIGTVTEGAPSRYFWNGNWWPKCPPKASCWAVVRPSIHAHQPKAGLHRREREVQNR
jgi:phosphoribosylformylglycinamidine (FGAM) synthase-like enzyme